MKLSVSNIGWIQEQDQDVYNVMHEYGFTGLEIAPTRIIPEQPYEHVAEAVKWSEKVLMTEGFAISSMQSIWFGRNEKIFGTDEERRILRDYTKKAILFAEAIGCRNLVFGCPRNRVIPEGMNDDIAVVFFRELGDYAFEHNTVIGMEANPPIYNTNYINDTASALDLIKRVDSKGFLLNLDTGTMFANEENLKVIEGNVSLINHVHISEPGLRMIEKRAGHIELLNMLRESGYCGFMSIEMGKTNDLNDLKNAMAYISDLKNI